MPDPFCPIPFHFDQVSGVSVNAGTSKYPMRPVAADRRAIFPDDLAGAARQVIQKIGSDKALQAGRQR
jgi:hypothetical protein